MMLRYKVFDDMHQCTPEAVQKMLGEVSEQRRNEALRFRHMFGQFCCLKSWIMLRELLCEQGWTMTDWRYNEHGKPFLSDGPHFNISHCKEAIAVAIADRSVGIDVEAVRHAQDELIRRTMNEQELASIHSDRDFTRLWTQKEAVVKAVGVGITSFEQLQSVLVDIPHSVQTVERDKYIYSIAVNG